MCNLCGSANRKLGDYCDHHVVNTCVASHHTTVITVPSATPSTDYTPQPQHAWLHSLTSAKVTLPKLCRVTPPTSAWLRSLTSAKVTLPSLSEVTLPASCRLPTLSKVLALPKFTFPSLRLLICSHAA